MVYPRSMLVGSPYHESKNQSWRHFVSSNDFENQNMTIEVDLHNIRQGLRLLDVLWVDLAFGRIGGFKHHHVGSENVVTKIYVSRVSKSWILKPILETFRLIQSFGKHVFSKAYIACMPQFHTWHLSFAWKACNQTAMTIGPHEIMCNHMFPRKTWNIHQEISHPTFRPIALIIIIVVEQNDLLILFCKSMAWQAIELGKHVSFPGCIWCLTQWAFKIFKGKTC